jgi:hypothetical protein
MAIARTPVYVGHDSALTGSINSLVGTHGSSWGDITPSGSDHTVIFNRTSFVHQSDFDRIRLGQRVNFAEEGDTGNGARAIDIFPAQAEP